MKLTEEDVAEFRQYPVNKKVFAYLQERIGDMQEEMGRGGTLFPGSADNTQAETATLIGIIRGVKLVLEIEPDKEEEEVEAGVADKESGY